jgi:hypothetical protein
MNSVTHAASVRPPTIDLPTGTKYEDDLEATGSAVVAGATRIVYVLRHSRFNAWQRYQAIVLYLPGRYAWGVAPTAIEALARALDHAEAVMRASTV